MTVPERRHCNVPECKRTPEPGWAFCPDHLRAWLDRNHR